MTTTEPPRHNWTALAVAVKGARDRLDLSQREVADRGGPSDTTISQVEAGEWRAARVLQTCRKLDAGLRWPPGTAAGVLTGDVDPADAIRLAGRKYLPPTPSVGGLLPQQEGAAQAEARLQAALVRPQTQTTATLFPEPPRLPDLSDEQLLARLEVLRRERDAVEAELHHLMARQSLATHQMNEIEHELYVRSEQDEAARNIGQRSKGQQRRDAADRAGTASQELDGDDFEPR